MIAQRHLNLSISQRTVLVTVDMVRAALGVDADSVIAKVEAGELRWVFDVSCGGSISEWRFWAKEIIAPEFCAGLTLAGAMKEILGSERARWRGTEIQHLLLVSRPTVKKLHDDGALPGDIVGGTFSFRRATLETFLRQRLASVAPKNGGRP
jgi:hypothetical protein